MFAGVKHGVVLDGRSDDMIAGTDQTEDGQIVGFSAATGKHHFGRAASQQRSHGFTRALDGCACLLPMMMD